MTASVEVALTKSQIEFLNLDTLYSLFCGGFSSGKSYLMGFKAVTDAMHCGNAKVYVYEPEVDHIRKVAVPNIENWLDFFKIRHKSYNKNERVIETLSESVGTIFFKPMDDPYTLVGYESYTSHIDELDTLVTDKASQIWERILSRNRQNPKGLPDEYKRWCPVKKKLERQNRISAYTTPEGYRFCYQMWEELQLENYGMVRARTLDNPTVSVAYYESLKQKYSAAQFRAYTEGEFVNMDSGTVYHCYNKDKHRSFETIQPHDTLYIGLDFNVGNMAATVYVRRDGGREWHAVAELNDKILDTPNMIRAIRIRWPNHKVIVYPDASGRARKSSDASVSDIAQLKSAGFEVRAHSKNPLVADRVAAANKALENGTLFVNDHECPVVSRCLIQQCYDKNGEPDKKSGNDHQNDATTYPIAYECAIHRPLFKINYSFAQRA